MNHQVSRALDEVRDLYRQVVGTPAPEIQPVSYASFPPGVDPLDHALREVKQLQKISEQLKFAPRLAVWAPPADTYSGKDEFVVRVEVPGITRDDLKVFVGAGECIVRGERKPPSNADELPMTIERSWGQFERRFVLPTGCQQDRVSARCHDGVLEIRIAAGERTQPVETKVEID
ncbi:MAG TPA: Hsp20/alpha crystallin family protein [Candidatus Polarisedimenticolaceae bacterium]|nr:Hsp20/alpha crystallin family protein [Candidatus Polarisedimenticolaceae bacterium]